MPSALASLSRCLRFFLAPLFMYACQLAVFSLASKGLVRASFCVHSRRARVGGGRGREAQPSGDDGPRQNSH